MLAGWLAACARDVFLQDQDVGWERRGAYNKPTAKMAKTPILRLVGSLSFEMR